MTRVCIPSSLAICVDLIAMVLADRAEGFGLGVFPRVSFNYAGPSPRSKSSPELLRRFEVPVDLLLGPIYKGHRWWTRAGQIYRKIS